MNKFLTSLHPSRRNMPLTRNPLSHQSQEHSGDIVDRRILTGCDAREMIGVYLQRD